MGTIAARDCLRILELTEQVAAAHTLATVQAARLRLRINNTTPIPPPLHDFMESVTAGSAFVDEDRALESDLRALTARIAACDLVEGFGGEDQHE